jgi:hypothetical protein
VILLAGVWLVANGVLHDVFILLQRKPFDRELIHLLIDGHLLIFSGVIYLVCAPGIPNHDPLAFTIAIANAVFMLGYCSLIFKILPSYITLLFNTAALVGLIISLAGK